MRIDRTRRARWPGIMAMLFNLCALVLVVALLGSGEGAVGLAASSILQVAGIRASAGGSGVAVDSSGQIRYRSRTITLEDLVVALRKDLQPGSGATITVLADAKADAARVAQVLRAAGTAGAQTVRLGTTQE
jgi:biopolymer transport protein ExbD